MPDSTGVQNKMEEITTFDAIVVGSGISGGWAAKELCEKGLKTLVLERGRNVEHIKDYPTANTPIWDFKLRGALPKKYWTQILISAGLPDMMPQQRISLSKMQTILTYRKNLLNGYVVTR